MSGMMTPSQPDTHLGSDVMLKNGDYIFSKGGDFFTTVDFEKANAMASRFPGYHNIFFSLADRLLTQKGANSFHPEYGSDIQRICSSPMTDDFEDQLRTEVHNTLIQDERVKNVDEILIEFKRNNTVMVTVSLTIAGTEQKAKFVFPNFIIDV